MQKPDFRPSRGPVAGGFNPWRTIWTSPRSTVRMVIADDPTQWLWVLLVIGGMSRIMARMSELPIEGVIATNALLSLVFVGGPLAGLLLVFAYGRILHAILRRFGGVATWVAARTAIVWSLAPGLPSIALWAIMIAGYGPNVLSPAALQKTAGTGRHFILAVDYFVQFGLTMWSLVLEIITLADVHRLNPWRVLLAEIGLGLALLAVAMGVFLLL